MIILEGTITNKVIQGARGEFSVGTLKCDEGEFSIKSSLLDPFEEGEYQARVTINNFKINTFSIRHGTMTMSEILIDITALKILDEDIRPIKEEITEPDVTIDDNEKSVVEKAAEKKPKGKIVLSNKKQNEPSSKQAKAKTDADADVVSDVELKKLFGHLWPLGDTVKLDTTTPRAIITQQVKYLRDESSGYEFISKLQVWKKVS